MLWFLCCQEKLYAAFTESSAFNALRLATATGGAADEVVDEPAPKKGRKSLGAAPTSPKDATVAVDKLPAMSCLHALRQICNHACLAPESLRTAVFAAASRSASTADAAGASKKRKSTSKSVAASALSFGVEDSCKLLALRYGVGLLCF